MRAKRALVAITMSAALLSSLALTSPAATELTSQTYPQPTAGMSVTSTHVYLYPTEMYQLQVAGGGEGATFAEGATSVPDISVTPSGMIDFLLNTPGVFPGTHTIPVTVTSGGQTATTNVTVTVYPYTLKQSSVTVQPETNNAVRLAFSSTGTPMPSIMSFTPEGSAWATDGLSLSSEGVITGTPSSTFESGTPLQVGIMFEQVTQGGTKLGMKLLETINLPVTES